MRARGERRGVNKDREAASALMHENILWRFHPKGGRFDQDFLLVALLFLCIMVFMERGLYRHVGLRWLRDLKWLPEIYTTSLLSVGGGGVPRPRGHFDNVVDRDIGALRVSGESIEAALNLQQAVALSKSFNALHPTSGVLHASSYRVGGVWDLLCFKCAEKKSQTPARVGRSHRSAIHQHVLLPCVLRYRGDCPPWRADAHSEVAVGRRAS
mmetsp:Transcript_32259/g.52407  ORF Transcript_32259/g.52407 Transcript_32259/m.52407 type:complete len:212 (+) Transcript_32259:2272-2907(+)